MTLALWPHGPPHVPFPESLDRGAKLTLSDLVPMRPLGPSAPLIPSLAGADEALEGDGDEAMSGT